MKIRKPFRAVSPVGNEQLNPGEIYETSSTGAPANDRADAVLEIQTPYGARVLWARSEIDLPENADRQNAFAFAACVRTLLPLAAVVGDALTDEDREQLGAEIIEHIGRHGKTIRETKVGELIDILKRAQSLRSLS